MLPQNCTNGNQNQLIDRERGFKEKLKNSILNFY